jgi:phospholipid/cholesterol/gamma-HCH transport system permease protein
MTSERSGPDSVPSCRFEVDAQGRPWVRVTGIWRLPELAPILGTLQTQLAAAGGAGWDLTQVSRLDQAGAAVLWRAWGARLPEPLALRPEHEGLFAQLREVQGAPATFRRRSASPLMRLGFRVLAFADHLGDFTRLTGRVVLDLFRLPREPARIPWKEISANVYRTGAQALGITALVGFLVGVVLSYLSAQQLRLFGAEVFIVNLLGIAVIRELGPVLAAILIAGRSGSAITAQIGVMRVTQELDAMTVMGIPHTLRIVLPKTVALAIAMPLLVLWTNAIALVGGMLSAQVQLGLDYRYFLSALPAAVPIANLWLGLGKAVVFGILIALIACHYGLRIKPNTESLGSGTTNSVVTSITMVILVDAVFAVMFSHVGVF